MKRSEDNILMKRIFINALYSLFLLLFIPLSAHSQGGCKVVIFDTTGDIEKVLLEIAREEICAVVVKTTGYTVLERELINKALDESRFQGCDMANEAQISDFGKWIGADYVFVSTIFKRGKNYYITCKMIEVSTARIDKPFTRHICRWLKRYTKDPTINCKPFVRRKCNSASNALTT